MLQVRQVITFNNTSITGEFQNAIIKIVGVCSISGTLTIGQNCTLDVEEGVLSCVNSNAVIVGNNTEIRAAKCQIFENVRLAGTFSNSTFPVEWFGAKGDGVTDNYSYIQQAFVKIENLAIQIPLELGSAIYKLGNTIVLTKKDQSIVGNGCLLMTRNVPAFEVRNQYQKIDIREIRYQ